jgi:triosephosphate isomerase
MTRLKIAAGNWKMNGFRPDLMELEALIANHPAPNCEVLICPPATLLSPMADIANGAALKLGGQDCHMARTGAHTGDISAAMLAEAGASYVIVGHSERRADHGENDAIVRAKAEAALDEGLTPIICIGETLAERDAGQTLQIVTDQLSGSLPAGAQVVVAYEPVWAIGTGKVATPEQIAEVHDALRTQVGATTPLLYGGSVKPGNAAEIFALENVDGALVGGASLKAADFGAIIAALGAA